MPSTGTHDYQAARQIVVTTTGNIDNLDIDGASLILMNNNVASSTIRGIKAGFAGQIITIISIGLDNVFLAHQNVNSSAANRLINTVTGANTPLANGKGYASYQYDATTLRWRLIHHEQGAPLPVTFNSGDYTANGAMTWTVDSADVLTNAYYLIGKILYWTVVVVSSTVGGVVNNQLRLAVPGGFTITRTGYLLGSFRDNATGIIGQIEMLAGTTVVNFYRDITAANWSLSTDLTAIQATIIFEVN